MSASPPPLPSGRGLCTIEKLGGVSDVIIGEGVPDASQVSVRKTKSRELSRMKSCKTEGLSSSSVIEETERILRQDKDREERGRCPGLSSMSPQRRSEKKSTEAHGSERKREHHVEVAKKT